MQFNIAPIKKERSISSKPKPDTKKVSFDLYQAGKSIGAIAAERKLTTQTIEGHLAHYIELGALTVDKFISMEKQEKIKKVFDKNKEATLTQMKEYLPEIEFGELRMMMASLKK